MKKHYTIFTLIAFFVFLISFKNAYASHITFSNIRVENAISSGAQIKWTTNIASDSRAVWGTAPGNYTAYNFTDCFGTSETTDHCVNVTGLSPGTIYYYKVESGDSFHENASLFFTAGSSGSGEENQGNGETSTTTESSTTSSSSSSSSSGSEDTTSPSISDVHSENIYFPGAQIKWMTDEPSDSKALYGLQSGSYSGASVFRCDGDGFVTAHCIYLDDLPPGIVYYFKVESADSSGNRASSGEATFISASNVIRPLITNVQTLSITSWSARVKWTTDILADSKIYWGQLSGNYPNLADIRCDTDMGGYVYEHCVSISGLFPNTAYYFKIVSRNETGEEGYFESNVTTSASGGSGTATTSSDTIPPSVSYFNYFLESDGKTRAGVSFSEPVDQASVNETGVYLIRSSDGAKISGTLMVYSGGVDVVSSAALSAEIDYQLVIKKGIKDFAGNQMDSDYISSKFRG